MSEADQPNPDLTELRFLARLAWYEWPDDARSRKTIADHEEYDPYSAQAWKRVVSALVTALSSKDKE